MNITHLLFSYQGRIRRMHFWLCAIGVGVVFWRRSRAFDALKVKEPVS